MSDMPEHVLAAFRGVIFDRQGKSIEMDEYLRLLGIDEYRTCAFDMIGAFEVSTVWLGIDASVGRTKRIFETIVFDKAGNVLDGERYATEDDAAKGHALWCARAHAGAINGVSP